MADVLIALNQASLDKFASNLRPGGTLFTNSSIANQLPNRSDITVVPVPVTQLSIEMGNEKVLNVIMLGAFIGYTNIIPADIMLDTILKKLGKKESMIAINKAAFLKGVELGRAAQS